MSCGDHTTTKKEEKLVVEVVVAHNLAVKIEDELDGGHGLRGGRARAAREGD